MRPTLPRRRRLRSPDNVASEEAELTWLDALTQKALARELPTRAEARNILQGTDDELMDVVAAAFKVRLRYFGRRVKLNYLVNIKSGLCPEDCFYCSQRLGSAADVLKYTWLKPDEVLKSSEAGVRAGAKRVCLVASGRGPTDADVTRVSTGRAPPRTTTTSTRPRPTTPTSAPPTPTRTGPTRSGRPSTPACPRARA